MCSPSSLGAAICFCWSCICEHCFHVAYHFLPVFLLRTSNHLSSSARSKSHMHDGKPHPVKWYSPSPSPLPTSECFKRTCVQKQ